MERIISDTRREHTKAIVSLQQLERKMQWQKQNNDTQLKESEEVYKHELNQLKRNIRELEKERNILVTTIKQENIKIPRQRHVGFEACPGNEILIYALKNLTKLILSFLFILSCYSILPQTILDLRDHLNSIQYVFIPQKPWTVVEKY